MANLLAVHHQNLYKCGAVKHQNTEITTNICILSDKKFILLISASNFEEVVVLGGWGVGVGEVMHHYWICSSQTFKGLRGSL